MGILHQLGEKRARQYADANEAVTNNVVYKPQ